MKTKILLCAFVCGCLATAGMAQTENAAQNSLAASDTVDRVRNIVTSSAWVFHKIEIMQIRNNSKTWSHVRTVDNADSLHRISNYLGYAVKHIVFTGDRANVECGGIFIDGADYEIMPVDRNSALLRLSWQNNTPAGDIVQETPPITVMYRIIVRDENTVEIIYDGDSPDDKGKLVPTNTVSVLQRLN